MIDFVVRVYGLHLRCGRRKKVDDSNRLRERNAGRPSSTPSPSTDHVESDCGIGTDIQVYDGGVDISYPVLTAALPPHDTDESGGTFC